MAIDLPKSDLSRSIQHDADQTWPHEVKISVKWVDAQGRAAVRSESITSAQFFGHGAHGAPIEGAALIGMIERMRRAGPPKFKRKAR